MPGDGTNLTGLMLLSDLLSERVTEAILNLPMR